MSDQNDNTIKGRGAQSNPHNPFSKEKYGSEHIEGIDEHENVASKTKLFFENSKTIINKVDSPDLGLLYSMNPYQGCEHGCVYCYARNSHQYWGLNAGLDFESKIIIKENAPILLEQAFLKKNWKSTPIMLSGNTDCYQPVERKLEITKKMLEVLLKYKNPVSIITKNSLILRDSAILAELASENLVHVNISITTLDEKLRKLLEPRTASAQKRLQTIEALSKINVPVRVMAAPIIPGLNSHEIPAILKLSAEYGALGAGYTIVRLNGSIGEIFEQWIRKAFPGKADKVLNQIAACHGGKLNDSRFGTRMKGQGSEAESIASLFKIALAKYFDHKIIKPLNTTAFKIPPSENSQLSLF